MPHHYRRGDVSNTAIRAKLYSEGFVFDKDNLGKHLSNKKGFYEHTEEALRFQGNKCLYCRVDFDVSSKSPQRDHLRPMEQENAGLHTWGNILFCCSKCNKEKDRYPTGWKGYIQSKPEAEAERLIREWQKNYNPG